MPTLGQREGNAAATCQWTDSLLNASPLHPSTPHSHKGQTGHNEAEITNTTPPEQTKDTPRGLRNGHCYQIHWGVTFQMSKAQHYNCTWGDWRENRAYMTCYVSIDHNRWCVYMCVIGSQSSWWTFKPCPWKSRPSLKSKGMTTSIPSCTGLSCVILVMERKRSWEANTHREVFLVAECGDWWQGSQLRWNMLSNPHLNWAEIRWIWSECNCALKPINVLQVDHDAERYWQPRVQLDTDTNAVVKDGSPQGILGNISCSPSFTPLNSHLAILSFRSLTPWWYPQRQ